MQCAKPDWTDNKEPSAQGRSTLYRLLRKDKLGRQGGRIALYMRECIELCLGMEEEPAKNLWLRIKEKTSKGNIIVSVCPTRKN